MFSTFLQCTFFLSDRLEFFFNPDLGAVQCHMFITRQLTLSSPIQHINSVHNILVVRLIRAKRPRKNVVMYSFISRPTYYTVLLIWNDLITWSIHSYYTYNRTITYKLSPKNLKTVGQIKCKQYRIILYM